MDINGFLVELLQEISHLDKVISIEALAKVQKNLSFPHVFSGNMVLIKPDSRLRHAGMTNLEGL